MKNLNEYIAEAINEARIYLKDLSDEELLVTFWKAWSGYDDPRKLGISGNPRAKKIEDFIYDKFDDSSVTYEMINTICNMINDEAHKITKVDHNSTKKEDLEKVLKEVEKIIKDNIDTLVTKGEIKI